MKYKETLTYKDITEIPLLLKNFKLSKEIDFKNIKKANEFFLLGRGSSGNATLFAKYIFEEYCGLIINFIHPYSIFNAKKKLNFNNKFLFSFSQSGKSTDIIECSQIIKKWGAKIIAITNESNLKENKLALISNYHILLSNSKELPVAATKSFELQLWTILRIAEMLNSGFKDSDFDKTIKEIQKIIDNFESILKNLNIENSIKKANFLGFVGRGAFNAISEDSALKFREMAFKHSMGYSSAEFLHGPIGSYGQKDFVILFANQKKLSLDIIRVVKKLEERKTPYKIIYPFFDKYPFNTILTDVFFKILAIKIACDNSLNPDKPDGLSKVTFTR